MSRAAPEIAPAKLNLALHVRGKLPDGRHSIETLFTFCTSGDTVSAAPAEGISLTTTGPFSSDLCSTSDNLVIRAAKLLANRASVSLGAAITLDKRLPVASGLGGGSADAAATLRLLTSMWSIDPAHAQAVAPILGSDVPACLLGLPARGEGPGDRLREFPLPELSGAPVLLVNPGIGLSTARVFARWDGKDLGPLGSWREGRNDLERPAVALVPQIESVLAFLRSTPGATIARMSGSGATCFALFEDEEARDLAARMVRSGWWRLATNLR